MLSERDTTRPDNRYRWGACDGTETQVWSRIYGDFDECYEDYLMAMASLRHLGINLFLYKWRGVFNLEQAALLVAGESIYADNCVPEGAD